MSVQDMERAEDLGFARGAMRAAIIHADCGSVDRAIECIREALARLDANSASRIRALVGDSVSA